MSGRDHLGRFAPGYSPDRGRGRPAAGDNLPVDADLRRIVMATANIAVSIPRGRGRRVVTLYEAQIRRLVTGRVYRRAAVMDFIRLVHACAAATPPAPPAKPVSARVRKMQVQLERVREIARQPDSTDSNRQTVQFFELLLAHVVDADAADERRARRLQRSGSQRPGTEHPRDH